MIKELKKIRTIIIGCVLGALIVVVGIVGVIKVSASDRDNLNKAEVTSNKENEVKEIAKQLYIDIIKGDKQKVYDNCSEEYKLKLTDDKLEQWHNEISCFTFREFYDIQYSYLEESNLHYVLVVGEFEDFYIQLECCINDENKVSIINNIVPYSDKLDENVKAIETDIFKEEVVKVGKYDLTGILTLPKNKEKVPVVLIVSGSGPTSANGKTFCLNPYQDIAYGLAKYGIATLRVNDRYYEKPSVATSKDTVYDEYIDDASASIELLSKHEKIDADNIFILGHSQGGSVMPKIAEINPNVKGLISMAGAPRSLIYGICEQYMEIETNMAKTDIEKEAIKEKYNKLLEEVLNLNEYSEELVVAGCSKAYFTSLNNLNIEDSIKNIEKPILITQGDKDVNVTLEKDFELWKELLKGKENASFKIYEGLSHNFTKSFGYPLGAGHINDCFVKNHVEDVVIKDIAEFINNNVY